jgi:hypothetical protein
LDHIQLILVGVTTTVNFIVDQKKTGNLFTEKEKRRWKVEGGRWKVEGGRWKVEGGRWKVEGGRRKAEGGRLKADGGRSCKKAERGKGEEGGGISAVAKISTSTGTLFGWLGQDTSTDGHLYVVPRPVLSYPTRFSSTH